MKAFEIAINGRRFATVGTGGTLFARLFTLSESVNLFGDPESLGFFVGGIDSRTGQGVDWSFPQIRVGDEVCIRIVETDHVDPPDAPRGTDPDNRGGVCARDEP